MSSRAPPIRRPARPTRPITVGVLLVVGLLLCGAFITLRSYVDLHKLVSQELELRYLSGELLQLQSQLASSARLAAETGEAQWQEQYRRVQPQFDDALRRIVAAAPENAIVGSPTWAASAALAATEARAFGEVRRNRPDRALALLTSEDYRLRQAEYVQGLQQMAADMNEQASARLALERQWVLAAAVLGLALLVALAAAWLWTSGVIQQYLRAVERAELELEDLNRGLENRVRERTAEVSAANRALHQEMEQRSRMELELRHAQKLEAVGRLAAGVAHEINTPVHFVNDSCHFMQLGLRESMALVDRCRASLDAVVAGRLPPEQARMELDEAFKSADMEYMARTLPEAAVRAIEGLERIAQIVRSLKEYSHPGGSGRRQADINRAIESTLTIARHEYKYVADVRTDLGDIPPVTCYPGELNQAILNLIVNAAHAIEEKVRGSERRGLIRIRTWCDGPDALIEVEDDGCGIAEENRDRIFEHFFTTKEVGRGTGQGLAIAHAVVVHRHHGKLTVQSEVGRGTTFTIRIPVEPAADALIPDAA